MLFKIYIFVLFFKVQSNELGFKTPDNFGPFKVEILSNKICKGPKAKDLTIITLDYYNNGSLRYLNSTALEDIRYEELKIAVFTVKNNNRNLLWSHRITNPCKHFAIAAMIDRAYDTKGTCIIKKGSYSATINFSEISTIFYGTSFFYGQFVMKTTSYSRKGNILCYIQDIRATKKSM